MNEHGIIRFTRERLYNYRRLLKCKPTRNVLDTLSDLGILCYRGKRGGQHLQRSIETVISARAPRVNIDTTQDSTGHNRVNMNGQHNSAAVNIDLIKPSKNITIACQNVRSAGNKGAAICDSIVSGHVDILVVSETWHEPNDSALLQGITPSGFSCLDRPRPIPHSLSTASSSFQNHGGIAIVYNSAITVQSFTLPIDVASFEYMCCRVRHRDSVIVVLAIYRPGSKPPSKQFFNELTSLLEVLVTHRCPVVLTGDFNIRVDRPDDQHAVALHELISSFDFVQHVSESTHDQGGMLDLIITKSDDIVSNVAVEWNGISDHAQISFSVACDKEEQIDSTYTGRCWKSFDHELFARDLLTSQLSQPSSNFDQLSLDEVCNVYKNSLTQLLDKHAPIRTCKKRSHVLSPWFDDDCRMAKRRARRLKRRYYKSKTVADRTLWIAELKSTSLFYQKKRNGYWQSKISENKGTSKKLWSSLNTVLGRGGASKASTSGLSAQGFSKFFVDKTVDVVKLTSNAPPPTINHTAATSFSSFKMLSTADIEKMIIASPNKQCDLDPAPTWLIKRHVTSLAPVIAYICNRSLTEHYLPPSQKAALVHPLLKKPNLDKSEVKNYRPISNLTFLSKLIERVVGLQLTDYLESNNILPTYQSAYRHGHSTETALLKVYSDFCDAIDRGELVLLGLLDLSSAFDTVDYEILLRRLELTHGIGGDVLGWLRSYLTDRTQTVVLDDVKSATHCLTRGVPQGSVLGPILFLLYTTEVPNIISSFGLSSHVYADDTQMYIFGNRDQTVSMTSKLVACFDALQSWMSSNRLKLNPDKTEFIWFASSHNLQAVNQASISVGSVDVKPATSVRDLGVTFDNTLSMNDHISNTVKSCFFQLRQLRHVRRSLTKDNVKNLLHAFVTSRIDYCNALYSGLPQYQLDRLQSVLNAAARLYANASKHSHVSSILRDELHWLRIPERVAYKLCLTVSRCLHGLAPNYLSCSCVRLCDSASRVSRNRSATLGNLSIPRHKTKTYGPRSFRVSGPTQWNALPTSLKQNLSLPIFKSQLKTHLFNVSYS